MEGVIVGFSDFGSVQRAFAVIKLGDDRRIVVPVEKLLALDVSSQNPDLSGMTGATLEGTRTPAVATENRR